MKGKLKFIIRDDDLNYFSTPKDILWWYEDIFTEGIPVSFSAIPFVKKSSDVFTGVGTDNLEHKEYPFGDNVDLVNYIKSNKKVIEILQHGCTHETIGGIFEFKKNNGLFVDVARGYEYLRSLFGDIKIFVAPHDSFSNHGILAVESIGLDIIRSKGSRNFLFRGRYVFGFIKMSMHRVLHLNRYTAPAYPDVVHFGKHKEAYSYRLSSDSTQMNTWLQYAHTHQTHFIVVNHLHDRDEEVKKVLMELILEAKKLGFEFVVASSIFNYGK